MTSISFDPHSSSSGETVEIEELVTAKAKELFDVCDKENKGYLKKEDLQGLHGELPLDDEQLSQVFERLDSDQSGFLSFEEFCVGFGGFLGLSWPLDAEDHNSENEITSNVSKHSSDGVLSKEFASSRLRGEKRERVSSLADEFVQDILEELNATREEKAAMEKALKERSELYEKRIHELSEEMEDQIRQDREKIMELEKIRGRNVSIELKNELKKKDDHLDEVISQQRKLEEEVTKLQFGNSKFVNENNKLMQMNENLAKELRETRRKLDENHTRAEYVELKNFDDESAIFAEEEARRLAVEKKSLQTQMKVLREHNRKLRDQNDEILFRHQEDQTSPSARTSTPSRKHPFLTQGSNLGKYFPEILGDPLQSSRQISSKIQSAADNDDCETTKHNTTVARQHSRSKKNQRFYRKLSQVPDGCSSSGSDDATDPAYERNNNTVSGFRSSVPDRMYKVVVVGNSGVGKTSFIRRFVSKTFNESISATIGIDYQVKSLSMGDQQVALQIWDTAGQERFRSLTRQYFRKTDGIIVVYDITNEKSFLSVRNWMQNIQEETDLPVAVMLLGNKSDVTAKDARQVKTEEGAKLADEFKAKFFETSAKSGKNVTHSMTSLSLRLADLEDKQREQAIIVAADNNKGVTSSCCLGNKSHR